MTDLTTNLRLEVQTAANDVFVWGVSTWTGYRWGGPADTAESGIEWLNILGPSHEIKVVRGAKRDGLTLTLEAGTLEATVLDSEVDPNTNPYIKPGTPMRLVFNDGVADAMVFSGVIRQVTVTYRGKKPQVRLSAVDRTKDLANLNRSGVVAGTFAERVDDLLTKHGIPNTVTGSSSVVLAQNAYDSTLLSHLQLAATSEQGRFFVSKDNEVIAYGKDAILSESPVLMFSDVRATGNTEYVDIAVGYDSLAMVNDMYVNNLTHGYNEDFEPVSISTKYGPFRNVTSIATFGAFTEEVETNLSSELDVEAFANEVLAANQRPELRVDSIRFNATDAPESAASLEVYDTINVEYSNEAFHIGEDFYVLSLEHTITADARTHRWMVDVGLISKEVN